MLVIRSEAWRLTLADVKGPGLPRPTIHAVNAGAFVMGSLRSQAAPPTRVALLGRHPEARALRPGQIGVADVPIFLLELLFTGASSFP